MENFDQPIDSGVHSGDAGLQITPSVLKDWKETGRWAGFLAILLFVVLGIVGLVLLSAVFLSPMVGLASMILGGAIYSAILLIPALYYYRFSRKIKTAIAAEDADDMHAAFANLMRFYRYVGILTIIFIALYCIVLLIAGAAFFGGGLDESRF